MVIKKIELFQIKNNKLPSTLSEIGIKETEEGPFFYRKISQTEYMIWFGTSLGESKTYNSKTKKWK